MECGTPFGSPSVDYRKSMALLYLALDPRTAILIPESAKLLAALNVQFTLQSDKPTNLRIGSSAAITIIGVARVTPTR